MTKRQKILLSMFLAMFLLPEVLWGAVFNALMSIAGLPFSSVYHDVLFFNDYPQLAYAIIVFELVGISGIFYLNSKIITENQVRRKIFAVLISLMGLVLLFLLFMNYEMNGISFP